MGKFKNGSSSKNKTVYEALVFLTIGICLLSYSLFNHYNLKNIEWMISPYLFPALIAASLVFISLALLREDKKISKEYNKKEKDIAILWKDIIFTIIISIIYYGIMHFLNFIIPTVLFLSIMFLYYGEKKIYFSILISSLISLALYGIFHILLKTILP